MYKQFVAWSCNGSSVAPLTDYIYYMYIYVYTYIYIYIYVYIYIYIYNPIYQELIDEDDYFNSRSNERIYLDLMASSGYTSESKKLERNDSKINLHLLLSSRKKKAKSKSLGAFNR